MKLSRKMARNMHDDVVETLSNYMCTSNQRKPFLMKDICLEKQNKENPVCGEVYSIHHYVIKFVSDLEFMVRCNRYNIM